MSENKYEPMGGPAIHRSIKNIKIFLNTCFICIFDKTIYPKLFHFAKD